MITRAREIVQREAEAGGRPAHPGIVAVHAVVGANDVHRILVPLREAGATGILVVPVEKLLP